MEETKVCCTCKEEKSIDLFSRNKTQADGYSLCCKECSKESNRKYSEKNREKNNSKYKGTLKTKICTNCLIEKEENKFYKKITNKDGLYNHCIDCCKEYYRENRERFVEYGKKSRNKNKERKRTNDKKYRENNSEKIKQTRREWYVKNKGKILEDRNKRNAPYSLYFNKLSIEEDPISDDRGIILCRCSYCKKYFYPSIEEIRNRIFALNSDKRGGESRLYCSDLCKQSCDVYGTQTIPKSQRLIVQQTRCHQSTNREMLLQLQIDEVGYNYCEQCGKTVDPSELQLHHNLMVSLHPSEADNMSHQILVCKEHHNHEGCF